MEQTKYRRALVKISGEALSGGTGTGIDFQVLGQVCSVLKACVDSGVQLAIVVGAGNFWRGARNSAGTFDRTRADHMGMLATTMNAIAIAEVLEQQGVSARVFSATPMPAFAEAYNPNLVRRAMEEGSVVVLGGGTGNPFVSTDTGAVLRALECKCDIALLAKNIDGVYDKDPRKHADAVKFDELSFDEVLEKRLGVIDMTAASMAGENHLPVLLFAVEDPDNIRRALTGENVGTILR